MTRLPVVSGKQAVSVFKRAGWVVARQESSHVTLKKQGCKFLLTFPLARELDIGTLRRLVRDAGLTVAQFRACLGK